MQFSNIIKEIRKRTGDSQKMLAAQLNVSFATVNRWEMGHCEPAPIALDGIRAYCKRKGIDYAEFEGSSIRIGNESIILFHGSKSGITGEIKPISRKRCDFGRGFYMGTEKLQPLTLICNFPSAILYTMNFNLNGLRVLELEVGIDWALLIAYNRGKMEHISHSPIYRKYSEFTSDCDIIIGDIANDRMFIVLDRFFTGDITDVALINSLSVLKLGKQYVALSEKACMQVDILKEYVINEAQRNELRIDAEIYRLEGITLADEICRKHRRDGRFFDEIIDGGM
jgi:transcriptional regulator with XRE-family HTH domain